MFACKGQPHVLRGFNLHALPPKKIPVTAAEQSFLINAQRLPLTPSCVQLWAVNTPSDIFIPGYKIFFQHPGSPIAFLVIVLHVRAVKNSKGGGQLLHVFIIKNVCPLYRCPAVELFGRVNRRGNG